MNYTTKYGGWKVFFMKISKAFLAYCEEVVIPSNGSINTESSYRSTASNLIAYFGDIEISSLTIHDVRRWRALIMLVFKNLTQFVGVFPVFGRFLNLCVVKANRSLIMRI